MADDDDDLFPDQAKLSRDEALERVRLNGGDWQAKAFTGLTLLHGFVGTAEDIRLKLTREHGLTRPHHHNAWGSWVRQAIRRKLLVPTGERRCMKSARSNARKTDVYRVDAAA